jgi:hypothetical protein
VPIHVQVWLASPAGLARVPMSQTRPCLECHEPVLYIYISESGSRVNLPEAGSLARLVRVWAPLSSKAIGLGWYCHLKNTES